jgi:hypothetical protein
MTSSYFGAGTSLFSQPIIILPPRVGVAYVEQKFIESYFLYKLLFRHYSDHPKPGHLNNRTIQFRDKFVSGFWMILFPVRFFNFPLA